MDYAFNDSDLRVKKDVSDLKLDSLILEACSREKLFFRKLSNPSIRSSSAGVWRVIAAITRSKRFRAGISFCA